MNKTCIFLLIAAKCMFIFSAYSQQSEYDNNIYTQKTEGFATDTSIWSIQNNPAGMSFSKDYGIGIRYKNYYGFSEIHDITSNICFPIYKNSTGISYASIGNKYISETLLSYAISRNINKSNSVGIGCNAQIISNNISHSYTVFPDFSFISKPTDNFMYGIHCINPLQIIAHKKSTHSIFTVGCKYKIMKGIHINCTYLSQNFIHTELKIGIECTIQKNILLFITYSNNISPIETALQWRNKKIILEYKSKYIPTLGLIQKASFIYLIKKK